MLLLPVLLRRYQLMNFKDAASDLEGLENEMKEIREDVCTRAVEDARNKCATWGIEVQRIRRRRRMPGELARDAGLTAEEEAVRVMKSTLDRFQQEVNTRFTRLNDLNSKFGFLLVISNLIRIDNQDMDLLRQDCLDLGNFYDTDVDGNELFTEIKDCRMLLNSRPDTLPTSPLELLHFIISYGDDVFPNLRIALQILLTISVSIAVKDHSAN